MGKNRVNGVRRFDVKRGRPKGNPTPLSSEEKRERNTILERQRRDEMADAFRDLQNSLETPWLQMNSRTEIIQHALKYLERKDLEPIDDIIRQNMLLEEQIKILETKLCDKGHTPSEDES